MKLIRVSRPGRSVGIGVTLALLAAATAFAASSSVKVSGPSSPALGSTFKVKVSGYFNMTKGNPNHGANFAVLVRLPGTVTPSTNTCHSRGTYLNGGPQKKAWRENSGKPGPFSVTTKVSASKPGKFTLCAYLGNYPAGGLLKRALHHYTVK